jgi:Fe-S-cluster-containing hydrogenase component 2
MSKNQVVWIDPERCTGCGACVKVCPVGAIALMDGRARVDDETCTGCGACLDVCPQQAIQPLVEGELVETEEPTSIRRSPSRAPSVQPSRPLVDTAAPVLAIAGAGLLAKATRAVAQAVGRWLTQSTDRTRIARSEGPSQPPTGRASGRANGRGRRMRRRRRGR